MSQVVVNYVLDGNAVEPGDLETWQWTAKFLREMDRTLQEAQSGPLPAEIRRDVDKLRQHVGKVAGVAGLIVQDAEGPRGLDGALAEARWRGEIK